MKVKEIMKKPVFIKSSASKKEIFRIVKRNPETHIFIVGNKKKKFKGDIHENDLFFMFLPNNRFEDIGIDFAFYIEKKFFSKTAKDIMRENDEFCYQDDDIMDIALKFSNIEVNEMPVLNKKNRVVGVITQGVILRHLEY